MNTQAPAHVIQTRIITLLNDLPPGSLTVVEQFVRFLRDQARRHPSAEPAHPVVPLPASVLGTLIGLAPPLGGDALANTEALYGD